MNGTRRDFTKVAISGAAALFRFPILAAADTSVRGVKLGITTASLIPSRTSPVTIGSIPSSRNAFNSDAGMSNSLPDFLVPACNEPQ